MERSSLRFNGVGLAGFKGTILVVIQIFDIMILLHILKVNIITHILDKKSSVYDENCARD